MKEVKVTMRQIRNLIGSVLLLALLLPACSSSGGDSTTTTGAEGLPNPASVYCGEQGGTLDIRTDEEGNQFGVCVFDDGSECDEWAFYRGECTPGAAEQAGIANPASVYCEEQGGALDLATGMCTFPDGSQCEEWAFFRGECAPGAGEASMGGQAGLPNPAAAYCEEQGGTVDIRSDEEGNQFGVCVFDDGSECDEWAFFRGECSAGG